MLGRALKSPWTQATIGMAVGGGFLWLAIDRAGIAEISRAIDRVEPSWLVAALALYGVDLAIRAWRWQVLLRGVMPLPYRAVGEVLVVGYGVNTLLPARLGELFRAEFFKRVHDVPRVWALGSIIIERMLDGITVVLCLLIGLVSLGNGAARPEELIFLLVVGAVLFAGVFVAVYMFGLKLQLPWIGRFKPIVEQIEMFRRVLAVLRSRLFAAAALTTLVIYAVEGLMLWTATAAVGVELAPNQLLVLLGAVSLSTLLPSAPGFLGTYQLAFALTLELFAQDPALGVTAATLIQLFLFLPVALLALALIARASWRRPMPPR